MKIVIIIAAAIAAVAIISGIALIIYIVQEIIEERRIERLSDEYGVKDAIERTSERIAEDNDEYNYGHQVNYENKSEES